MEATNDEELSKTRVNGEALEAIIASPVEYRGQRVITLSMMDRAHGRPSGTARRNFNANRARLVDGRDCFVAGSDEIRSTSVATSGRDDNVLLTESGYLLLVKSFRDDLAWEVQRRLVETYFRARESVALQADGLASVLETKTLMAMAEFADRIATPIVGKLSGMEGKVDRLERRLANLEVGQVQSFRELFREQQERRTEQSFIPPWAARLIRQTITEHAKAITRNSPDPKAYRRQRGADELSLRIQFGFCGTGKRWEMFPIGDWPRMSNRLEELRREAGRILCGTQLALSLAPAAATAEAPAMNPQVQGSPAPAPPLLS